MKTLLARALALWVATGLFGGAAEADWSIFTGSTALREKKLFSGNGKQVIYFVHGFTCNPSKMPATQPDIHYFLRRLGISHTWDIISAEFKPSACSRGSLPERAAIELRDRASELRASGYKRIVLAGQSLGAWGVLLAGEQPEVETDAILAIAPARFSRGLSDGTENDNFDINKNGYFRLLPAIRKPLVVVFFAHDEYDPGGRGPRTAEILGGSSIPHLIIDSPHGFSGHGSGWLPVFDYAFGSCINTFLEEPRTTRCVPPALSNTDFRSVVSMKQLSGSPARRLSDTDAASLLGKTYAVYPAKGGAQENHFVSLTEVQISSATEGNSTREISFKDGRWCYNDGNGNHCQIVYIWPGGSLIDFDEKTGLVASWWEPMF